MENINTYGKISNRLIYNAILKNSRNGYLRQNIPVHFSYETNKEYDDIAIKITHLDGFSDIKAGNELQTLINATNWVSRILQSDGEPTIENVSSFEIINKVQQGVYAANCYAHAVVLNDVFHLLGYKSKYIFCEPIDYHYSDNHVVNHVFSEAEQKWMLFDSAQGVYFTKKSGEIMSICDLREYIINNTPFDTVLLDGIWSDIPFQNQLMEKNQMIIYMTKNLYRFSCFENSYMDRTATQRLVSCYGLVPRSYMETPVKQTYYEMNTKIKYVKTYYSDDMDFWKIPEV